MNISVFQKELEAALLSAPIVYIPHFDYEQIDLEIKSAVSRIMDSTECIVEHNLNRGIVNFSDKSEIRDNYYKAYKQLDSWLECIIDAKDIDKERVFLFKNLQQDALGNTSIQTLLQTFAAKYKHGDYHTKMPIYTIVIISPMPVSALPYGIEKICTMIEYPNPTEEEIRSRVDLFPVADSVSRRGKSEEQFYEEMTHSLMGLHLYEVDQILRTITINPNSCKLGNNSIKMALREKQRIVKKSGIIEVVDTNVSFDEIGGLEKLKEDLCNKSFLFRRLNEIQDKSRFNIPIPKGVLIIGMPGCGKTMIAKSVAQKFGVSLLRLDVNRLMGQYVGMSEENLRRALQTAETAHPCVLWIDEVEKAFAGAGAGGGDNDMLVQRLMGQFLTWMQERETAVYIVATANDVMRPEFMRKGRFDEVYFVDFPNIEERTAIMKAKLGRYGFLRSKTSDVYDFSEFISDNNVNNSFMEVIKTMTADGVNQNTNDGFSTGFSGAEIESVANQLIEKTYIRYCKSVDANEHVSLPLKVRFSDFVEIVKEMRPSIMANQIIPASEKAINTNKVTNIERIREMEKTYRFTKATK